MTSTTNTSLGKSRRSWIGRILLASFHVLIIAKNKLSTIELQLSDIFLYESDGFGEYSVYEKIIHKTWITYDELFSS